MTIYKIANDDNFSQLFPDLIGMAKKVADRDAFLDVQGQPVPLKAHWLALDGIVEGSQPLGDVCKLLLNELVFSSAAREIFDESLSKLGEFLPISHSGGEWFLFNPLISIEADPSCSDKNKYDEIINIGFLPADVNGQWLWTSPFSNNGELYCSQDFVNAVSEAGLKGLVFCEELGEG